MSTQKSLADDVKRIDGKVNGLFAKVSDLADRIDELEEGNERLRSQLEDAQDDADLAVAVAGETSDARADGGPTKVERAEHLSRNDVVRQAVTTTGKGGPVTAGDVVDMARPETNLYHRTVHDAWDKLVSRWGSIRVQERDDAANRLVVDRDDLEDELVRLVDDDLSDTELAEELHRGRT
jgi:outer membrane murein-binding lipoprotein Lpp